RLHVGVIESDTARVRSPQPGVATEQRRFARAIRPQQRGHAARRTMRREVVDDGTRAQADAQPFNTQPAHASDRRNRSSMTRKNGPPSIDIAIPSRTSDTVGAIRTRLSASKTSSAPPS